MPLRLTYTVCKQIQHSIASRRILFHIRKSEFLNQHHRDTSYYSKFIQYFNAYRRTMKIQSNTENFKTNISDIHINIINNNTKITFVYICFFLFIFVGAVFYECFFLFLSTVCKCKEKKNELKIHFKLVSGRVQSIYPSH